MRTLWETPYEWGTSLFIFQNLRISLFTFLGSPDSWMPECEWQGSNLWRNSKWQLVQRIWFACNNATGSKLKMTELEITLVTISNISTHPKINSECMFYKMRICNDASRNFQFTQGVFSSRKIREKVVAHFGFIWQLLSNYEVISLKRFVSLFTTKLCN